jgi:short-subunit dehydrogenase
VEKEINMKTVVITGATSGIGNLLVKEFVAKGCRVFAGYRNAKFKKELIELSENVIPFRIDMSKSWTISDAVKFILEELGDEGKIDTLINAAGCAYVGPMEYLGIDKIREQFEVNTFSHLQLTQGLFEKLKGGRIINISSTSSFGVYPFIAPYCASKRALDILFNSIQIECDDVKVISIKPGVVKTPLWGKTMELNKDILCGCEKYEKELTFLMENAKINENKGLDAKKVVELIVKVNELENPKPSYTVGFDAKLAEVLSHFPQAWINSIILKSIKHKMSKTK